MVDSVTAEEITAEEISGLLDAEASVRDAGLDIDTHLRAHGFDPGTVPIDDIAEYVRRRRVGMELALEWLKGGLPDEPTQEDLEAIREVAELECQVAALRVTEAFFRGLLPEGIVIADGILASSAFLAPGVTTES
jgi:hypothetical protein